MPNLTEATDTVCAVFKAAWPSEHKVEWPNAKVLTPALFDGRDPWARLDVKLDDSQQRTMAEVGSRVFERFGTATVQVFVPAGQRGLDTARALGMVALNAFEGRTVDGVRFVRVKPKDVGPDGHWYQFNVVASFEFDEVK